MPERKLTKRESIRQLRDCAVRLRRAAPLITGGRITPEYVLELADEFERCAEALERSLDRPASAPE